EAGALPARPSPLVGRSSRSNRPRPTEPAPAEEESPAPPTNPKAWRLPPLNIFEAGSTADLSQADVRQRAATIEETLASFSIDAHVVEVNQGPTVTQFGIEPAPGV